LRHPESHSNINDKQADWVRVLESLRYDIVRREPLTAHKEYESRHTVDVTLDDSGQIRMTITRWIGETKTANRRSKTGRDYRVFSEQNAMTIIVYHLRADDDLAVVLNEMEKEIAGNR
jgi:hypothetical protein